jgi:ribosome-associated protein
MEPFSKTQKKKEALYLQALGEQLVTLSIEQLKAIDLPPVMYHALILAKTITKHGARLRQMQYIGTLMRKYDPKPVEEALERLKQGRAVRGAAEGTAIMSCTPLPPIGETKR